MRKLGELLLVFLFCLEVWSEDEGQLSPVVITGSNIPTVALEGASPIVRIDREEIDRSGAETVGELLRRLPQNNSGSYDEKHQNSFAPGTSGVSLRGLGMSYTLVLVDGRRLGNYSMAQNMTTAFSDLNGVPMAVVERIEVLLDGASAIYGSDAIAGVINIITRDNFDGLEINVGYSNTTDNDMGTQRYSITGGTVSDKGNAWITFDYMQRNSVQMNDRDFSSSADQRANGGVDFRSKAGYPGSILILPGSKYSTEFTTPPDYYKIPAERRSEFLDMEIIGTPGVNLFDQNPWMNLTPEIERSGASGRVNYILNDYATAFVDTMHRKLKTHIQMAPTPAFGDINKNWGILPSSNHFNPFVISLSKTKKVEDVRDVGFNHRFVEIGPRIFDIESEVFRFLPGLKFNIGDSWQAETAILYNSVESVLFGRNFVSEDPFKEALASSDPATAYNIFGPGLGINSASVLDLLRVNTLRRAQSELRMFDVKAAGDLAELPGGTLALAVGVETAKEDVSDLSDSLSMANKIVGHGVTSNAGGRSRDAAYAEFMVPIIGEDNRIAGIHSLGLQAAWRVEHYSDFGFADNPKFGVKYSPEEHVLLRATYQTAFRAPSLQQLYMGKGVSFPFLIDPKRGDVGMQYKTIASGNQNLQPEEADSFSVGTVFDIPMPDDMSLSVSVNWSQIELEDQIASLGAQYMLLNEELFKDNIERDGQDNVEHINISFLNLAEVQTEAVDLQINYSIDTSIGHLGADLAAAYLYQYDYKAGPSDSFVDLSGSYNRPEWRGHMGLWWTYDKYSAGATVNYVDSFDQLYGVVSKVDEHTTLDLQASYNLTDNFRLTVGARNVTDEDPPWSDSESQGYSFAAAGHSPLGTILYGRITIRF